MALTIQSLILLLLNFHFSLTLQEQPFSPNALLLHVSKDPSTLQYVTQLSIGSSFSTPVRLAIDLSGSFLWMDCSVVSSQQDSIKCSSLQCLMASQTVGGSTRPCEDKFRNCNVHIQNPITDIAAKGELNEGVVSLEFIDGKLKRNSVSDHSIRTVKDGLRLIKTGSLASRSDLLFSCATTSLMLKGLGNGVKGMLGLGNSRIALPLQAASNFGFSRKFALCLSSSNGIVISGENPYDDISRALLYTPFSFNGKEKHHGYYINVQKIKINGKKLALDKAIFQMNHEGLGGAIISTTAAYTTMLTSIYEIFIKAYIKAAKGMNLTRVAGLEPFEVCFSSRGVKAASAGPNVPIVDLVLQSDTVKWRIHGRNSVVHVNNEVMCLGILNGGLSPKASIVIGGYQLEDNFLEFNLETSMLGFSSSLLINHKSCSNLGGNLNLCTGSL